MKCHVDQFGLAAMCRVLSVHRSGYYAWLRGSISPRERDDQRLLGLIKHSWLESGSVYGHRKITSDLRELGETCSRHRVARLMKNEGLRAMVGYGRRPRPLSGPVGSVAKNVLARGFKVSEPNRAWVTDITYIRTYDGFMYLAVVLDLFSRQVVGWATRPTQHTDLFCKRCSLRFGGANPLQVCFCTLTKERSSPAKTGSASCVSTTSYAA